MMALAEKIGRGAAHDAVEHACGRAIAARRGLAEVLAEDAVIVAHLDPPTLARLANPVNYVGETDAVVDRVVGRARDVLGTGGA